VDVSSLFDANKFANENEYQPFIDWIQVVSKVTLTSKNLLITNVDTKSYPTMRKATGIAGSKQNAIIFMGGTATSAHELGHVKNLDHTFCCDEPPIRTLCLTNKCLTKYSSSNYMDYSTDRNCFYKYQWKIIYDTAKEILKNKKDNDE
jgi:hypothetical protein